MDKEKAISIIKNLISDIFKHEEEDFEITEDLPLIGSDSYLDSMKLVELCLALEDEASDQGFEFDWTSEKAMSKSSSIFISIDTLAAEYLRQKSNK